MDSSQARWAPPVKNVATILTILGALPFIVLAALLQTKFTIEPVGAIEDLLTSYGVLIATFIAGSHWGNTLRRAEGEGASEAGQGAEFRYQVSSRKDAEKVSVMILLLSNGLTLMLWFAWMSLEFKSLLICLIAILPLLLWIDACLYRTSRINRGYLKLRTAISLVVILSLSFAYMA